MQKYYVLWIIFILCVISATLEAETWEPGKTVACLIGILEWKDTNLAVYEKEGRQDARLFHLLQDRGVPQDKIEFLKDTQGTLDHCISTLTSIAKKSAPDSVLIFYYAGHGIVDRNTGNAYFLNYDCNTSKPESTCLALSAVEEIIKNHFTGKQVVFCADCCYSGNLNKVAASLEKAGKEVCVFSSATSSNFSTGQWTFTMSLCDALSGEPVVKPGGGEVTASDIASYIYHNMKYADFQMSNFFTTKGFSPGFIMSSIKNNQVLPDNTHIGEYKLTKWKNEWYHVRITGQKGTEVQIHYPGYDDEWDEWVQYTSLKDISFSVYSKKQKILVEWDGKWFPARIENVQDVFHYIKYDGYGDEWNEWVASNRIKDK
ncbi:MAG: caspase family protein [Spirochaetales bacterium]|nr:caspase family protein [Spirochaetales bacterium]